VAHRFLIPKQNLQIPPTKEVSMRYAQPLSNPQVEPARIVVEKPGKMYAPERAPANPTH